MSVKDMSDWTKKNELAIAKAKKEVMCDDVTNIDIPYCKTQIEKLRKTYPEDKELLKKIDYEERMIEVMKKKNELLLYASAQNTT